MTGAILKSGIVAAFLAVHPLHVESVAWISERKDVLSAFFFFLTLWAYAHYAEQEKKRKSVRPSDSSAPVSPFPVRSLFTSSPWLFRGVLARAPRRIFFLSAGFGLWGCLCR